MRVLECGSGVDGSLEGGCWPVDWQTSCVSASIMRIVKTSVDPKTPDFTGRPDLVSHVLDNHQWPGCGGEHVVWWRVEDAEVACGGVQGGAT